MTPKEINGFWWVDWTDSRGEHNSAGPFDTNSAAWRWIDMRSGEPISKTQDRHQWAFEKAARGKGL
jgi:hypothetical protein